MSMAIEKKGNQLVVQLRGKLSRHEFDKAIPAIAGMITDEDQVSIRVDMRQFEGWDPSSSWDGLDGRRITNVRKIAFVGDKGWRNWMRGFCRPFVAARIRFFEPDEAQYAGEWLAA
jgi:hypothetical protein